MDEDACILLRETRRALGQPLGFDLARVIRKDNLRYLQYGTPDGQWIVGLFGTPGVERLALINSSLPSARTRAGVGVGTPVPNLPIRLRAQRPICIQRRPFINYSQHDLQDVACATGIVTATTVFYGEASCAVPVVRYQGCEKLRVVVSSVAIESHELRSYNLSSWYPVVVIPEPPVYVPG